MAGGVKADLGRYAKTRVAPIVQQIVEDILVAQPTDPIAFIHRYLEENGDALRERQETTLVHCLEQEEEQELLGVERELLRRIERLQNENDALKKMGRSEIGRLKRIIAEHTETIARLSAKLDAGGDASGEKDNVEEESKLRALHRSDTLVQQWRAHLAGMHPTVADRSLDVSDFLGVGLATLNPESLQALAQAWEDLARDARDISDEKAAEGGGGGGSARSSRPNTQEKQQQQKQQQRQPQQPDDEETPTVAADAAISLPPLLDDELAKVFDEGVHACSSEDFAQRGRALAAAISASPMACIISSSGEAATLCSAVATALTAAGEGTVECAHINLEDIDFGSAITSMTTDDTGAETWEPGPLTVACRTAATWISEHGDNSWYWLIVTGDTPMAMCERLKHLFCDEKEIDLPTHEIVLLHHQLRLVVETFEHDNVPHQLQQFTLNIAEQE